MFVRLDNGDGTTLWINTNFIKAIGDVAVRYDDCDVELDKSQHTEIMAQLDALKLLYKPSEPMPPVGEPLREIVGEALMEFMNTKGRTD